MPLKKLTLHRNCFAHGTFSILCDENGNELCKIIERPWLNNQANISCVPFGTYDLLPHQSPKHGFCYALEAPTLGVTRYGPSQRTHVLFHKANKVSQLEGCLAPGISFGVLDGEWAVLDSDGAFTKVLAYLAGQNAKLIIQPA